MRVALMLLEVGPGPSALAMRDNDLIAVAMRLQ